MRGREKKRLAKREKTEGGRRKRNGWNEETSEALKEGDIKSVRLQSCVCHSFDTSVTNTNTPGYCKSFYFEGRLFMKYNLTVSEILTKFRKWRHK